MAVPDEALQTKLSAAVARGDLLPAAVTNIRTLLAAAPSDLYSHVVTELAESTEWSELNDRFYKTLAFGTGGLRGRTMGKVVTPSERGNAANDMPPQFPCVGTNAMNFFNISRATQGLVAYLHESFQKSGSAQRPRLVIAHDTRFFSREFTALAARVASENGCDSYVFSGPRSTPELSFAVRCHYREPQSAAR